MITIKNSKTIILLENVFCENKNIFKNFNRNTKVISD